MLRRNEVRQLIKRVVEEHGRCCRSAEGYRRVALGLDLMRRKSCPEEQAKTGGGDG